MLQWIEPFVGKVARQEFHEEDELTYCYNAAGEHIADVYEVNGNVEMISYYGEKEGAHITPQQLQQITYDVQYVFRMLHLFVTEVSDNGESFVVELRMREPKYRVYVPNSGMRIDISYTGFVECVVLREQDVDIVYPAHIISKDEARAILHTQPIMKLGIAPDLNWQYAYVQNFDLYGIGVDGHVRLWSEEPMMQDAKFEALSDVEAIADLDAFLLGGRQGDVVMQQREDEYYWRIDSDDDRCAEEAAFVRACRVVKQLAGEEYANYYFENIGSMRQLLEEDAYVTMRFVYIIDDIAFDFHAISVHMNTETNQILSVSQCIIPYDKLRTLKKPTLTLEEANAIVYQYADVELTLERDMDNARKMSFVYELVYPTSPTGAHLQFVDGFTGDAHWICND